MADTDQVDTYLAEVRERSERPLAHIGALPIANDAVRGLMESAADVPRLLAAVEAAFVVHQPISFTGIRCATCHGADGGRAEWPCLTYRALSRALLGEGESG